MQNEDPLFKSAHSALVFAFNYSSQQYDRPMMNRMADGQKRTGKGLAGLDGAAQAGMIRAELASLPALYLSIVTARFAPKAHPCSCRAPCCSGARANTEWITAIEIITAAAITSGVISGRASSYHLRRAVVESQFTKPVKAAALAGALGTHIAVTGDHIAKIALWLKGYHPKHGGEEWAVGEIDRAVAAAADKLITAGFV